MYLRLFYLIPKEISPNISAVSRCLSIRSQTTHFYSQFSPLVLFSSVVVWRVSRFTKTHVHLSYSIYKKKNREREKEREKKKRNSISKEWQNEWQNVREKERKLVGEAVNFSHCCVTEQLIVAFVPSPLPSAGKSPFGFILSRWTIFDLG